MARNTVRAASRWRYVLPVHVSLRLEAGGATVERSLRARCVCTDGSWLKREGTMMRHGRGVYIDGASEDQVYEGEWFEDAMQGRGTFRYASGAKYEVSTPTGRAVRPCCAALLCTAPPFTAGEAPQCAACSPRPGSRRAGARAAILRARWLARPLARRVALTAAVARSWNAGRVRRQQVPWLRHVQLSRWRPVRSAIARGAEAHPSARSA